MTYIVGVLQGCGIQRWWAVANQIKEGDNMTIAVVVSIIALVFSVFFGAMTLLFTIKNSKRTDTKDLAETIKDSARINVMLEMISNTTQEIKTEIVNMRKEIQSHESRLVKLEESCKSAHHRLDELIRRLDDKEDD